MNHTDPRHSFFPLLLGGRQDRELKVAAAFAACFRHSAIFRTTVLGLFGATCGVRVSGRSAWTCESEVTLPTGRIDLQISSVPDGHRRLMSFWVEMKVQAPLTASQLRRYKRVSDGRYLMALTKHPPETGRKCLEQHGIYALRWQDIHRALVQAEVGRAEQFLVTAFIEYLEAVGMAHREDIRIEDLDRLNRLFGTIGQAGNAEMSVGTAFDVGSSCLGLMDDVMETVLETHGKQLSTLQRFGPSYFKWFDNGQPFHCIGFRFHNPN